MVERWHRDLKAAFMCATCTPDWYFTLPSVLVGLRARIRLDVDCSPAEMAFGQTLRIPGDFIDAVTPEVEPSIFMQQLRTFMSKVKPIPFAHHTSKSFRPFVFKELKNSTHVFKLIKKVKPPLTRPYTGPHKVIEKHPSGKYFKIEINGKHKTVSIKHLKPAFFVPENFEYVHHCSLNE